MKKTALFAAFAWGLSLGATNPVYAADAKMCNGIASFAQTIIVARDKGFPEQSALNIVENGYEHDPTVSMRAFKVSRAIIETAYDPKYADQTPVGFAAAVFDMCMDGMFDNVPN
jgi:hypothetical protein